MATSQQKKAKEQFFQELDRLDQLVSDDDEEQINDKKVTMQVPETPVNQMVPHAMRTSSDNLTGVSASKANKIDRHPRKRKSGNQDPGPAPKAAMPAAQTLPGSGPPVEPTTKKTKPARPRGNVTNMSNLRQRKRQLPRVMQQKLKPLPVEQQTFTDLVFCKSEESCLHVVRRHSF
jgi:hypothetical protein